VLLKFEETLSKLYWKPEALKLFSVETIIYHYDTIISLITTISSIITKQAVALRPGIH
jgi:hypothetical protein